MNYKYINPDNIPYLRAAAAHFEKHGVYTKTVKGTPAYKKFWEQERDRCINGYSYNGDYISGYNYFYWNYSPIEIVEILIDADGNERAERKIGFPNVRDYDKYFFDYVEDAERSGKHACVLKARGLGYSFKGASMLNRNYFIIRKSKSFAMAANKDFLYKDGIVNKAWDIMDFIDKNTAFSKRRQYVDTKEHRRASYQKNVDGKKIESGYKSEIISLVIDDPNKSRGKRGKLIIYEEAGSFKNLIDAYNITRPSVRSGNKTFGLILVFGTGGDVDMNDSQGLEELFFNPEGYDIKAIPNIWSEVTGGKTGFFAPAWSNLEGFYNKTTGISDREGATKFLKDAYNTILQNAKNTKTAIQQKAEFPIYPEDAILKVKGSIFPVIDLRKRLAHLTVEEYPSESGDFVIDVNGNVTFVANKLATPIKNFIPSKSSNNTEEGAVIIYEHPIANEDNIIPHGLYLAGTDPYDDDESGTPSMGSTIVMNSLTKRIVAEYTGRPKSAKEYYRRTHMLLKYYNAVDNYEQNKKGMYAYFENVNALHYLADTPKILKDTQLQKFESRGNRSKGTMATEAVNKWGRELSKTYFEEQAYGKPEGVRNLDILPSIPLVKEFIYWDGDINTDRVSAFGMLMILLEDRAKYTVTDSVREDYGGNDPLFDRLYNRDPMIRTNKWDIRSL